MQIIVKTLATSTAVAPVEESVPELVLRLVGGAKKRKKKVYTKPKKAHHKHKKVKLATLKFYKVDSDGNVIRARKDCPNESCGAGVRMAAHKNRVHCGRCSLTFDLSGGKI